jgi:hypothetical protein
LEILAFLFCVHESTASFLALQNRSKPVGDPTGTEERDQATGKNTVWRLQAQTMWPEMTNAQTGRMTPWS